MQDKIITILTNLEDNFLYCFIAHKSFKNILQNFDFEEA